MWTKGAYVIVLTPTLVRSLIIRKGKTSGEAINKAEHIKLRVCLKSKKAITKGKLTEQEGYHFPFAFCVLLLGFCLKTASKPDLMTLRLTLSFCRGNDFPKYLIVDITERFWTPVTLPPNIHLRTLYINKSQDPIFKAQYGSLNVIDPHNLRSGIIWRYGFVGVGYTIHTGHTDGATFVATWDHGENQASAASEDHV
ncbi:hypothetical protein STEG23_001367 [Scotinomys teguina]